MGKLGKLEVRPKEEKKEKKGPFFIYILARLNQKNKCTKYFGILVPSIELAFIVAVANSIFFL